MARHLSTKDILNKQFKRSFRGFDIEEVDAFRFNYSWLWYIPKRN